MHFEGLLEKTKRYFWTPGPVAGRVQADTPALAHDHVERVEQLTKRTENHRPRRYPRTNVLAALRGAGGLLTLYPAEGETLVINIWISPNPKHLDHYGNRARKIFPVSYYRRGRLIASFPRVKGPSLPIGALYGKSIDPLRLAEEYQEELKLVVKAIPRGIEAYFADVIHAESA